MEHFLKSLREPLPRWLARLESEQQFSPKSFLNFRIAIYPGSGFDGHLVKVFGSTHAAHCFVYADYGVSEAGLKRTLDDPDKGFRGYHSLMRIALKETDILPQGWTPHVSQEEARYRTSNVSAYNSFGFVEILERNPELDDEYGAKRLAIMFLGADGVAAYDALFCQRLGAAPFAMLLQDHGFGGNYSHFGRGGLLEKVASRTSSFPRFILGSDNTDVWPGYRLIQGLNGSMGGARQMRRLYAREVELTI